jgi:hypothetical protein
MKKPTTIDHDDWTVHLDIAAIVWIPGGITFRYTLRRKEYPSGAAQPRDFKTIYTPSPAYLEKYGQKKLKQLALDGKRIYIAAFEARFSEWDSV